MLGPSRVIAGMVAASLLAASGRSVSAEPTAAQKQQAGDLVKRAIAKAQVGNASDAIDLYLQAYAILPEPLLLSNIGAAYAEEGKPVEALKYFCKYLDADPNGTNASYARAQAVEMQTKIGNHVDDKEACAPPKPVHVVAPPPPVMPVAPTQPPPPAPIEPQPNAPGRVLRYTGVGVAGLGIAGLALGFYYGSRARTYSNDISDHKIGDPWPDNIGVIEADGKSAQSKQIGFLVAGGVLVTAGVTMFVLGHHERASELAIAPVATPSSVGLVVGGGF